jgi:hypothetical protein
LPDSLSCKWVAPSSRNGSSRIAGRVHHIDSFQSHISSPQNGGAERSQKDAGHLENGSSMITRHMLVCDM